MSHNTPKPTRVKVGDRFPIEIAFSEVCMHMQVAGQILDVELLPSEGHGAIAQLYKNGQEFSAPILTGEAGVYQDADGYYAYVIEEDEATGGTE